ncbi:hypothetical protein HAX54_012762 [Datura stramonium]|uniref:Uncharacterized protein n=1 Tax=Datura stramonium TaxID=4076 RepID=A0ABS8RZP1_DATST|nr:hypothetical protein [Datura stramonium]
MEFLVMDRVMRMKMDKIFSPDMCASWTRGAFGKAIMIEWLILCSYGASVDGLTTMNNLYGCNELYVQRELNGNCRCSIKSSYYRVSTSTAKPLPPWRDHCSGQVTIIARPNPMSSPVEHST